MRIRPHLLLTSTLGLALAGTLAGSLYATQVDRETGDAKKTRRIVRVITTSDGSPIAEGDDTPFLIVGEDGFAHRRGYLGVQIVELTPELRRHFGAPEDAGVMISTVIEGSPAVQAGLRVGDVVAAIDGESVTSGWEVASKISRYDDESVAVLEVWRDGAVRNLSATIVERERPAIDIGRIALPDAGPLRERILIAPHDIPEHIIEIDQGSLQEALNELQLRFANPDFVKRFKVLGEDRADLQKHIEELEDRLEDLEKQLEKLPNE